ncbi:P-loop containing nucleoside triphosphate hydrolase protein [Serendipita vermifera]|nr:P-loop containing nucleoside triphosphate hydrolase protein [Serendipita vermifera]
MAKKRAAESEAEEETTLSKRARFEPAATADSHTHSKQRGDKGKNKKRREVISDSESEGNEPNEIEVTEDEEEENDDDNGHGKQRSENADVVMDDEEFEKQNTERVKEALSRKTQNLGAAESGVVSHLTLINFMCHKYTTFNFGPQVNFIIGNNGSGKSAALTAITVALGGKATSTGRGSGLKSFIKSGENAAEVSLTLRNAGIEAFNHEEYGDSINITRTFTQAGASSYKIKNASGKIVSNARSELSAILDHFQIDVDNPMNILTQDLARQFLSASNAGEKYQLFLKGTLLSQLKEEYEIIRENCSKTSAILGQKRSSIEELEEKYKEVLGRHEKAQGLVNYQKTIDALKAELAWAHLAEKEEELEKTVLDKVNKESKVTQLEERIVAAQALVGENEAKVNEQDTKAKQAATPDALRIQMNGINETIAQTKQDLRNAKRDFKNIKEELKGVKDRRKNNDDELAEQRQRLGRDEEKEAIRRRVEEAHQAFEGARRAHVDAGKTVESMKQELENDRRALQETEREFTNIRNRVGDCETNVNRLQRLAAGSGGPAMYGDQMPEILRAIDNAQWRGQKPLGPLGLHVKLKDKRWANALRVGIGNLLGNFAVTDHADRNQLKKILDQRGAGRTGIIVAQPDIFDYSSGEPPSHLLTVLRVLDISHEWVTRLLINARSIERLVLAQNRREAEEILKEYPRYMVWTQDLLRVQRFSDGGGQTASLGKRPGPNDFRRLLFPERSIQEELTNAQDEMNSCRREYEAVVQQKGEAESSFRGKESRLRECQRNETRCSEAAKQAHEAWLSIRADDVQETPIDLAALEVAAEELRTEEETLTRQLESSAETVAQIESQNRPLVEQAGELRKQIASFEANQKTLEVEMNEVVTELLKSQRELSHYQNKLEEANREVRNVEEVQEQIETDYKDWRRRVEERYPEVTNPRRSSVVDKELKANQTALQRAIQEQGQTVEEIEVELARARDTWTKAKEEYKDMSNLVRRLRKSLAGRMQHWQHFRQFISLRCKLSFKLYLSLRGFYGRVTLDHENGLLSLKVVTDDQKSQNGQSREKDAKMSGGEKSFSTICLLLSLWDAMGCPIRALDEFDVYMDAVNRRISMKMLLDAVKNTNKQHILITPQEMNSMTFGPEVRVNRMRDPERGQRVLEEFSG